MFILIWYDCVIIGMIVLKKNLYICSFFKNCISLRWIIVYVMIMGLNIFNFIFVNEVWVKIF